VTGVPTGFRDLDTLTGGWQNSDLIIIAGRPSAGKTAFALSLARNAATHSEKPTGVGIFSLEMSMQQLVMRLLCAEAKVDAHLVRTGRLPDDDWKRLSYAAGKLTNTQVYIDDTASLAILELRAKARRLKAERNIGLLVVDYLQLMQGPKSAENREKEISAISRSLKALAKELNIPVIALSQLSRAVESRTDKRPILSDLRESGAIEQDADVVAFVHRSEMYEDPNSEGSLWANSATGLWGTSSWRLSGSMRGSRTLLPPRSSSSSPGDRMKNRHSKGQTSPQTSRREFLRKFGLLAGASVIPARGWAKQDSSKSLPPSGSDEEICAAKFGIARSESLADRPIGEVVVAIGTSFIGTPYAAHTLEADGPERLIINLSALDCVTFVENTLALSRCIKLQDYSFDDFRKQLQLIRYRNGVIDGYASRLHYFSDWIQDNERKGVVRNVSDDFGGTLYDRTVDFMSTHPESYRQLSDDSTLQSIREIERSLNHQPLFYIPKENISRLSGFQPGDIIGITTSVEGLDISHTGLAVLANGVVKYLHAPLSGGSVQISESSLADYVMASKGRTGIMIARPAEPSVD
jgi:hypothetical protein